MNFRINFYFICILILFSAISCQNQISSEKQGPFRINSAHLDTLYEELSVEGDVVGIVHIYSEYPDYQWVGDGDEGIACVDDAARAAVFYLRDYRMERNEESLRKGKKLLSYLKKLQAPNGYFYNFIWPDGSIHREGKTTRAEANWWSWRTIWAYSEALYILEDDREYIASGEMLFDTIRNQFEGTDTKAVEGLFLPTWLPGQWSADQASILLMGLANWYENTGDKSIVPMMEQLAAGILLMQINAPEQFPDGAFLSWKNLWHAYGNLQSYSLLRAGNLLDRKDWIDAAIREIDTFYPALLARGGYSQFYVRGTGVGVMAYNEKQFSQIAYNYRPMVWACMEAYRVTGEDRFREQALEILNWYQGDNPAQIAMYDSETGRTFDGINDSTTVNQNSGAESTVEALLAIQAVSKHE